MNKRRYSALSRRNLLAGFGAVASLSVLRPKAGGAAERPKGPVTALVFDSSGLVLAADGVWMSADGGATFAPAAGQPASAVTAMATHPERPDLIYAAQAAGGADPLR